jgi:hypothetical protein
MAGESIVLCCCLCGKSVPHETAITLLVPSPKIEGGQQALFGHPSCLAKAIQLYGRVIVDKN